MKKFAPWLASALAGLILILLLNTSPLSRLGLSIELPAGWQSAGCAPQENNCGRNTCSAASHSYEGIPFTWSRTSKVGCGLDWNNLAKFLNALVGAGGGVLYIFLASKYWDNKRSK